MPVKGPVKPPVVQNWDGFYVGANVGYSRGRADVTTVTVSFASFPGSPEAILMAGSAVCRLVVTGSRTANSSFLGSRHCVAGSEG